LFCLQMYQHKAMALSDIDATNFELEQAVVESSLQTWLQTEHGRKKRASPVAGARSRRRPQQQPQLQPPPLPSSRASLSTTDVSADSPVNLAHSAVGPGVARSAAVAFASVASVASAVAAPAAASAASTRLSGAAAAAASSDGGSASASADEYPFVVQELVMNGFELSKVVRAYELVGDNFDDLLSILMSNTS
jgi:hypothetical protein